MILANGKIYNSSMQNEIIASLNTKIEKTLLYKSLKPETVVSALDKLSNCLSSGLFNKEIKALNIPNLDKQVKQLTLLLKRENIEYMLKTQLKTTTLNSSITTPPFAQKKIKITPMPLGTIFHVAAGNVDGLPAYSVCEGLLTGNINILKLPQADNDLSIKLLLKLIEFENKLKDFIYVFDTSSYHIDILKNLAALSDAIVVWGSDSAINSVRTFAPTNTKIIEWGHKISFCYISDYENKDEQLTGLAKHIVLTKQLLCSSCQVIYIDTDNIEDLYSFCSEFILYLENEATLTPNNSLAHTAEFTLRQYNNKLENILNNDKLTKVFNGNYYTLTACADSNLEVSSMSNNILVKRLPKKDILHTIRKNKGYLQTAGLICKNNYRDEISEILLRSGVCRVTTSENMSNIFSGESHDGRYPLEQYIRYTNCEI